MLASDLYKKQQSTEPDLPLPIPKRKKQLQMHSDRLIEGPTAPTRKEQLEFDHSISVQHTDQYRAQLKKTSEWARKFIDTKLAVNLSGKGKLSLNKDNNKKRFQDFKVLVSSRDRL